jgi:hypothetical protein
MPIYIVNAEAHQGADDINARPTSHLRGRRFNIVYVSAKNFQICAFVQIGENV